MTQTTPGDPDQFLAGPRSGPALGTAERLVVLLHGYGADGDDLFGLAGPLGQALPGTAFRSPNAPQPCRANPFGRQWFPIPWIDGSAEAERDRGFAASVETLNAYLDAAMAAEGVEPARTALVGFSQGTMMALHVSARRGTALAGIVGFSGRLLLPERLARETVSRPPILLVHGDCDEVIGVESLAEAGSALTAAGFAVDTHVSAGTPHGIAPDGLQLAARFLVEKLLTNVG
ncbi:MAG: dienelactone hydrolase family protein [Pseudomonadota bacterium]